MPGLTGVVVGRPTAEDSIVLTPVGVPSISFAIKICERPDAGVAEDQEPGLRAAVDYCLGGGVVITQGLARDFFHSLALVSHRCSGGVSARLVSFHTLLLCNKPHVLGFVG